MSYLGLKLNRQEFTEYVNSFNFGSIPPDVLILHHTYIPTVKQWKGLTSLKGIYHHYRDKLGWTNYPHIFVADDGIYLMDSMYNVGIHAGNGNARWKDNRTGNVVTGWRSQAARRHLDLLGYSIGIEVVGDYGTEIPKGRVYHSQPAKAWQGETKANAVHVIKTLQQALGLSDEQATMFHRDFTTVKSCPGTHITKEWVRSLLHEPVNLTLEERITKIEKHLGL